MKQESCSGHLHTSTLVHTCACTLKKVHMGVFFPIMSLYPSNIIYKNLKFKIVPHKPTVGNTHICGKLPSEPTESAEWEFLWMGLLPWTLRAWQGRQAEDICNQLLWNQGFRSSVGLGTAFSFLSFSAILASPFLFLPFLPTKEVSELLLETQISVHLATSLRNIFDPLENSTDMHVCLKHSVGRIVCAVHTCSCMHTAVPHGCRHALRAYY